ncbi:MAG: hypothetical protein JF597_09145 [Streptomyces sp.]|uniref:hypothetical protein n=1 Tax=Streptomyces sp. TaxID=1931 RepID=UPI0025D42CBD|nr:hypothetical protein [Streptomyces sp.]MBW8793739.1 hypothetical protein [Streptomyces sp.]
MLSHAKAGWQVGGLSVGRRLLRVIADMIIKATLVRRQGTVTPAPGTVLANGAAHKMNMLVPSKAHLGKMRYNATSHRKADPRKALMASTRCFSPR